MDVLNHRTCIPRAALTLVGALLASLPVRVPVAAAYTVRVPRETAALRTRPDATAAVPTPRPPVKAPARVITAEDLAALRGRVSVSFTEPGAGGGAAPSAESPSPEATPTGAQDEAAWRAAASALTARIAGLEREQAQLEQLDDAWSSVIRAGAGPAGAGHELAEVRRRRAAVDGAIAQARAELTALEDRARRERVPPGWLR